MNLRKKEENKMRELIGKSVLDVVRHLPALTWDLTEDGRVTREKIEQLIFIYYQWKKPKTEDELFKHISADNLDLGFIEKESERGVGLTSLVKLRNPEDYIGPRFGNIPFIDFDTCGKFDFLSETDLLELMKSQIRDVTELERGFILRSSSKGNYHFIGTGRLFNENDFVTFLNVCLLMRYKTSDRDIGLVDARHIGHALTPMKHLAELNSGWSMYDINTKFSTLRVSSRQNPAYEVVDVLGE